MAATSGRKIGKYEVESELGRGGMGVVHLAHQPVLERRVVLKSVRREIADEATVEERFLREARAAAALHHPNVVGVYDCFTWRGELFIAQEYVDGVDAASVIEKVGPIEPTIVARIGLEIARGLEEIHARGLVHRDLKPDNILLGRGGETKVADFGIALDPKGCNLTQTGHALGTPAYMSPEQIVGARVDFRSDLFAFGVLLYELLTGECPFGEDDPEGVGRVRRIEAGRYAPVRKRARRTPRALARVVRRCLRAKPARRFASTAELRRALERCLRAPSPADVRGEIAAWLEANKALPSRRARTRQADAADLPEAPPRRPRRAGWLAAAALALALAAAWLGLGAGLAPDLQPVLAAWGVGSDGPSPGPASAEPAQGRASSGPRASDSQGS